MTTKSAPPTECLHEAAHRWPQHRHRRRLYRNAARLDADKNAIGVFGLSFYQNNTDKLRVATMGGVVPSTESIASGDYPVSRPLFFYVKIAHLDVIPGLQEYVEFFVSDDMAGPNGPLAQYGLVSDPELAATQEMVRNRTPMGPLN
jgi:phosphate transport system substrate-binding protein